MVKPATFNELDLTLEQLSIEQVIAKHNIKPGKPFLAEYHFPKADGTTWFKVRVTREDVKTVVGHELVEGRRKMTMTLDEKGNVQASLSAKPIEKVVPIEKVTSSRLVGLIERPLAPNDPARRGRTGEMFNWVKPEQTANIKNFFTGKIRKV